MPDNAAGFHRLIDELAHLTTETSNSERGDLDLLSTPELVRIMNAEDALVPKAIEAQASQIASAIDAIVERMRRGGRLFYLGAGTPGRIGILDASECPPTFGTAPELVVGLIAGGPSAIQTAVENSEDDTEAAQRDLAAHNLDPDDTVVGISASGRTPYVVAGLAYARRTGSLTIALASNDNSEIGAQSDIAIEVVVGPELVAGSTRLKAGTAQKLVLNMLSTLTMVRLGKTFEGVMVDLKATNAKLRARSVRTVVALTEVSVSEATRALEACNASVKHAILHLRTGMSPALTDSALDEADGNLRIAIQNVTRP